MESLNQTISAGAGKENNPDERINTNSIDA